MYRAVFRSCYGRFRRIIEGELANGGPQIRTTHAWRAGEGSPSRQVKSCGNRIRINEEFKADFLLLAKRALRRHALGWKLFRFHFLLGAPWNLCAPRLGLDRGAFFHEVYRVQSLVGKAFAETEPYGIFPLDEYFGGTVRGRTITTPTSPAPVAGKLERTGHPLRAPLRAAA